MTRTHRFPTPEPIALDVRIHRGAIVVSAVDTAETTVEITGRHTDWLRVDLSADGRRLVVAPTRPSFGRHHLDVAVRLPAGSTVSLAGAAADISVDGVVASATVSCASGQVRLAEVDGRTEVHSASGALRVGTVRGPLDARSASGPVEVERVTGPCRIRSASGSVSIGTADGDVEARSASGAVRVREASTGTVDVASTSGSVAVGVRQGTLVWLDLVSTTGRVTSDLTGEEPAAGEGSPLTVRARTVSGSVSVTSAGPAPIAL